MTTTTTTETTTTNACQCCDVTGTMRDGLCKACTLHGPDRLSDDFACDVCEADGCHLCGDLVGCNGECTCEAGEHTNFEACPHCGECLACWEADGEECCEEQARDKADDDLVSRCEARDDD